MTILDHKRKQRDAVIATEAMKSTNACSGQEITPTTNDSILRQSVNSPTTAGAICSSSRKASNAQQVVETVQKIQNATQDENLAIIPDSTSHASILKDLQEGNPSISVSPIVLVAPQVLQNNEVLEVAQDITLENRLAPNRAVTPVVNVDKDVIVETKLEISEPIAPLKKKKWWKRVFSCRSKKIVV